MAPPGHASAEAIYKKVNKRMPGISLATVYKNLHTFIDSGLLGQVTLHHGSLLVDGNREAHHHLVCVRCRSITDLKAEELGPLPLPPIAYPSPANAGARHDGPSFLALLT